MKNSFRLAAGVVLFAVLAFGIYALYKGHAPGVPASLHLSFHASLSGAQEVLPVPGDGTGTADFTLDPATKTLSWTVNYNRLSSEAMGAEIHGPAARGANAGIELNLTPNGGMANPLTSSAVLTDAEFADLISGRTYININTANNKGGEIRGQIIPKP